MNQLCGMNILIAEDEYLLASDLADQFRAVGARVLGPFADLEQAARSSRTAQAAVLDINLKGKMSFPLADSLLQRGIPFVFFSAYDEIDLPFRFRAEPRLSKPIRWQRLADVLAARSFGGPEPVARTENFDIATLLPRLRFAARLHVGDPAKADDLVEHALRLALTRFDEKNAAEPVEIWLDALLEEVFRTGHRNLLH